MSFTITVAPITGVSQFWSGPTWAMKAAISDRRIFLAAKHRFNLASVQENSVANAWEGVSRGAYDAVAAECVALKKGAGAQRRGYYDLVRTLADGFCGPKTNESVVLQSFLMAEAGCRLRGLFLLLATDGQVYARPYFNIDGQVFYILDDVLRAASYNICNFTIPGERPLSLAMPAPPLFAQKPAAPVVRNFDGVVSTTVTVNRNLMDFRPCHWAYAATAFTAPVRGQLIPRCAPQWQGRANCCRGSPTRPTSAVRHRCRGGTTYSDCEPFDPLCALVICRGWMSAALLSGAYPTAVCQRHEGRTCSSATNAMFSDATYIGAGVGEAMPDLKRTPAQTASVD